MNEKEIAGMVEALEETLEIASRNETGAWEVRARAALDNKEPVT